MLVADRVEAHPKPPTTMMSQIPLPPRKPLDLMMMMIQYARNQSVDTIAMVGSMGVACPPGTVLFWLEESRLKKIELSGAPELSGLRKFAKRASPQQSFL